MVGLSRSAAGVRTPRRSSRPTPQRYEEEFELAQYPTPPPACTTAIGDDDDDALWSPEDDFPAAVAPTQQHEEEEEEEEEKQAAALRRRFTLQQDRLVASRSQSPAPSTISRAMSPAHWLRRAIYGAGIKVRSEQKTERKRIQEATVEENNNIG
ncbi:hypothetical protein P8C59_009587 [Phyllachora maydis]|uniref:Uncharacterized protein n=1 Tax=Phyllachora maydis TaxID=1825666 RepID=A0AAD9IDN4_9PEZI|nr:hypothetical protein P8C59_009587 [Phyllachora maydis]